MYFSDFGGAQDKMWKAGETIFPGLDFFRAHASLSSLPLTANGLDPSSALALNLHARGALGSADHHTPSHLSPTKSGSPPPPPRSAGGVGGSDRDRGPPSPRPGSANGTLVPPPPGHPTHAPSHLLSSGLNALNLIHQQQQLHHQQSLLNSMAATPTSGGIPSSTTPPTSTPGGSISAMNKPHIPLGLHHPHHPGTPLHHLSKSSYSSPPPIASNPEHNVCKLIEYRGAQIAAFMVDTRELICLPQAFELFLKHLVGGLHTVYTKLKRLEITPVVCNVEQVRILRGLGAIQPGVNRCKLISCCEFDTLYDDCTNSNARPGRPPKRVHCSNPVDSDVLEKLKRRKLDIPAEYPYDQRYYDRKPLMNGFPPVGYPSMPQFSNFFGMHPLMQPMAMASHIDGLRHQHQQRQQQQQQLDTPSERPKLERSNSDSGLNSPKPREERLSLHGVYGNTSDLDSRLPSRRRENETSKPLDLQINGHRDTPKGQGSTESVGSRSDEERDGDDADIDEDKLSEDERIRDDMEDSYDSNDDYGSPTDGSRRDVRRDSNPNAARHNGHYPFVHPVVSTAGGPGQIDQSEMFAVDFDAFVIKFNTIVRALVDAAKAVEKKAVDDKDQISGELVKEKERRLELERAMQEEKKKRAFFQRRLRRLKQGIRRSSDSLPEQGKEQEQQQDKLDRPQPESSPEPVVRNAQESGQHDSDSEKTVNSSLHSEPERERKSDCPSIDRNSNRREIYETYSTGTNNSSRSTPPTSRHTPPISHLTPASSRHTPPVSSPIKYPFHSIVSPAQDV